MVFVSKVLVGLIEAHGLSGVDSEVARVDIVALHDHIEDFRLMNSAFFHEVDHLILNCKSMVNIVIQLDLELVFELTVLLQEGLVVYGIGKVHVVFSEQVHLTVVGPRVEPISHGVLRPNAAVLTASEE